MGAGQSSGAGGPDLEQEGKTSYYELLGVQRQATEDEIKKAYRRKALELHPDRNYGNEEQATRTFAEIQAAYEVLSDSQERAWYDSHESAILRGEDGAGQDEGPTYENIRVTTADDLARMLRKFNSNVEFTDAPSGFFGYLRETFERLAKEEEVAATWENIEAPDHPSFGHKDDAYDDVVKHFYASWSNFSTIKTFAWKDKYRLSEAPDRWYRRRMEKENKTFRQEGIKEFNEAVRSLVAFVRKRDPRFVASTQSEVERQKTLRDAAASQASRARAANQAKLDQEVPEWTKTRDPEELEESEDEESEQEVFECVACSKTFKSERQWEAHEKSKKHQKAVYALQKKIRKENAHLNLDESMESSRAATPDVDEHDDDIDEEQEVLDDVEVESEDHKAYKNGMNDVHTKNNYDVDVISTRDEASSSEKELEVAAPENDDAKAESDQAAEDSDSDSDYASAEAIQTRLQATSLSTPPPATSEDGQVNDSDKDDAPEPAKSKKGKAAQKRAKKAAAAAAATTGTSSDQSVNTHKCATCDSAFPSKTRLFQHIKDHGHAAPKTVTSSGGGKGKKGKAKR